MYNIILRSRVSEKIRRYIDAYEKYYENLYSDSGLGIAEEIIIEQYRQSALSISNTIFDAIHEVFSRKEILGYKKISEIEKEITTRMENRRIFLTYIEKTNTRIVTDIEIMRL